MPLRACSHLCIQENIAGDDSINKSAFLGFYPVYLQNLMEIFSANKFCECTKGWIEGRTRGTICWPLRGDNKVECLCQLISSLNLKNKIQNVLVVSDKSEKFQKLESRICI